MKKIAYVLMALVCLLGAGCASTGMDGVERAGFLGDYSLLKDGGSNRAALVYRNPDANFKSYDKIMFDRVVIFFAADADHKEIDPAILKELTDYYQNALLNAVKNDYKIVDQPDVGVLRVRVAITDVKPSKPVANTLSTLLPVGWAIAGATKVSSGDNLGTGEASTEIDVLDSLSSVRLAAGVDRRQGGKAAFEGKWADTKEAFDYWATRFGQHLAELRGH